MAYASQLLMRTRGIILTPLRLYARSALGVTNEYIAAPSNCAARPVPERAVVSLSLGGGTSAPAAGGLRRGHTPSAGALAV